jgi:hypothetical protein
MILSGGFDLSRESDALILRATNGGVRWFGALFGGFAIFRLSVWIPQGAGGGIGYWFGIGIGLTFVVVGAFLLVRREITTIFDLRTRRVLVNVNFCNGWYERRQTYTFDEIASVGVKEYVNEGYSYMPVLVLRRGKTRYLATINGGYLAFAKSMGEIAAATGLPKMDVWNPKMDVWNRWG